MALSKALVQPFRKNELVIGAGWRAFFADYNVALGSGVANTVLGPTILDLQNQLPFNTNAPPAGWNDLGWIKEFKLTPASKIGQVRSGYRGAVRAQYRGEVGESFDFKFREATRMAFKIAVGNSPFNLISGTTLQTTGPLSASGANVSVTLMASGYQVNGAGTAPGPCLFVPAGSGAAFAVGNYIVCDADYLTTQYGIVGPAGVPIQPNQVTDIDYIRKTSDFVARITQIVTGAVSGGDALVLDQAFAGGGSGTPTGITAPPSNTALSTLTYRVEKISGWAVREGATFISEWSAALVLDTIDAAQILIYYPHISIGQFKDIASWALENAGTTDESGFELDCSMNALAFDDPIDGETVVGYKCFIPRPNQNIAY